MSDLSIIMISLSSVMAIGLILVYVKYWKGFKVISKSVFNEISGKKSKSATISFLAFSLFFGVIFTIVLSAHTSNYYYEDKLYDDFVNYNTSLFDIHAGDITTDDFFLSDAKGSSSEIEKNTVNGESIMNNPDDIRKNITQDIGGRLIWSGGTINDLFDRDYLSNSDSCVSLIKGTTNDPTLMEDFSHSSPLYKIGSKKADKTYSSKKEPSVKGLQNSYLYCADYYLAEMQRNLKDTNKNFSYSFTATSTFTGFSINSSTKKFNTNNVRIVTVPEANERNTNDDGVIVNQPNTFGEYTELNLNEAYLLDFKHDSGELNSLNKNDYINLNQYSSDIKIVDRASSMQYIKPSDYHHVESTISVSYEPWLETDNIVLFVNEDTLYNILKENYTDIDGDWDSTTYNTLTQHTLTNTSPQQPNVTYDFFVSMNEVNNFSFLKENGIETYRDIYEYMINVREGDAYVYIIDNSNISFRGTVPGAHLPAKEPGSSMTFSNVVHTPSFWYSSDNFQYTYNKLGASISSVNIFSFFILIIGLIVIAFLISRSFRNDVTWMGNLKSLGYSQSTVSLLLVTKIIIYLLLGILLTFIITPLLNLIWGGIQSSAFSFALPLYYITWSSIAFTIFFPFLIFVSFTFIVARFFFISKPTLSLVKDEILAKPNFIVRSLDKSTKLSFSNSYSMKNSIRTYAKSSAILISSLSISVFILLSFSISDTLERSVDEYQKEYAKPNVSLMTSSIKSGGNSKISTMSNEEFINGINDGIITEYTFGIDETNKQQLITEGEANGPRKGKGHCDSFDSIVVDYLISTPIKNTYISNQTLSDLNEVFSAYPISINCSDTTPTAASNVDEITNAYSAIKSSFADRNTDYTSMFHNTYSNSLGITLGYDVIDTSAETLMYLLTGFEANLLNKNDSNPAPQSDLNIAFVDKFKYINDAFISKNKYYSEMENSDNGVKDGKIYFYINTGYVEDGTGETPFDKHRFYEDEEGQYMYLNMPYSFYSSNSVLTPEERKIKVYLGGYVNVPFFTNAFLSLSDPDWDDILKSNVTTPGHSANNNIFASSEVPPSSYPFVFLPDSNVNSLGLKYGNNLGLSYLNFGSKMAESFALDLSDLDPTKYDYVIDSYYNETLTISDVINSKSSPSSAAISQKVYLFEDINLLKNFIGINSAEYLSGISVDFSGIITKLANPSVESFQKSVNPVAIMAIISAISLIFIVINEIIKDNKNNTNSLKTLGHSSFRTTIISYVSYPIILLIGFGISIPITNLIGSAVSSSTGSIMSLFTLSLFPSGIQILYTLLIIISINIAIILIAYAMTKNLRPKLSLYRN